nr:hypothetical protein [[Eubacterium] tenue]
MTQKSVTFKFDMSNQNDALIYFFLAKLDTDKVKVSCKLKELILHHINENPDLKTLLLNSYYQLSENRQMAFEDISI